MKFKVGDLVFVDFEKVVGKGVVINVNPSNVHYQYTVDFSNYLKELKHGLEDLHAGGTTGGRFCYWVNEDGMVLAEYKDDLDNWI